jgi:hypothetical protein
MKKPPRISPQALAEVETALRQYIDLVVGGDLSNWAKMLASESTITMGEDS